MQVGGGGGGNYSTKVRDIIKEVEADGWVMQKRKGTNHRQFKHPTKKGKVTISGNLGVDVPPVTLAKIRKQAEGTP